MEYLYNRLPKDLVYIIEDYAKDRIDYNVVISELNWSIKSWLGNNFSYNYFVKFGYRKNGVLIRTKKNTKTKLRNANLIKA